MNAVGSLVMMTSLVGGVTYFPNVVQAVVHVDGNFIFSGTATANMKLDSKESDTSEMQVRSHGKKVSKTRTKATDTRGDKEMKTIGSKRFGWSTSRLGVGAPSTES